MILGGLLAFANWSCLVSSIITKRFHSAVPIFGAVLLGAGMLMLPRIRSYAWFAVILDYGTLAFLFVCPGLIREAWRTSRFNLISEYLGQAGIKAVRLRLFRHGVFTIRLHLTRPKGQMGLVSVGTIGAWQRESTRITLHANQECAILEVTRDAPTEALRQCVGFASWERTEDRSLANIDFIQNGKRTA
jgi:hypothetical protein